MNSPMKLSVAFRKGFDLKWHASFFRYNLSHFTYNIQWHLVQSLLWIITTKKFQNIFITLKGDPCPRLLLFLSFTLEFSDHLGPLTLHTEPWANKRIHGSEGTCAQNVKTTFCKILFIPQLKRYCTHGEGRGAEDGGRCSISSPRWQFPQAQRSLGHPRKSCHEPNSNSSQLLYCSVKNLHAWIHSGEFRY